YIPTNLISITDGQIYLSPDLFQKGVIPAVDVGKSVSRVGGEAQLPAYRAVAGDLRLSYSQFEELEAFSRFGTRLDDNTRKTLERGHRIREVLKQAQYKPLSVPEQIAALLAVTNGLLDFLPLEKIGHAENLLRKTINDDLPEIKDKIVEGKKLDQKDLKELLSSLESAMKDLKESGGGSE
ncbi:F0F1 ATP synthase subunit alpha, partial [Candidatus Sumerlaeota bacterium]|nr:F0F1 ATP synthase subunit alpha [Candidatus Sumerlaeota bacterium]